jgi:hypothetical protein
MGIPKPQRLDAARLQELFPFRVVVPLAGKTMLAAVQFHIQFRLLAKEIQIIITEGMLAAEFVAAEPPVTQSAPQEFFRPGFILPKMPGAGDVGHVANLGKVGTVEKLLLTPALTCVLSLGERSSLIPLSVSFASLSADSSISFLPCAAAEFAHLSPGQNGGAFSLWLLQYQKGIGGCQFLKPAPPVIPVIPVRQPAAE